MASGTLDLAAWRRMKAVRQGIAGSFATLWNEYASAIWSVVRPLCEKESEAIGWCGSFRLALEEGLLRLDPVSPLAPQIGSRLYEHLAHAFQDVGPIPTEVLPPTAEGLTRLPVSVRLPWLVELFFDVPEEIFSGTPSLLPRLRAARRCIEPVMATDLRIELRQTLSLPVPEVVMMLPPGAGSPPPRRLWPLWIPAIFLTVVVIGTPMVVEKRWDRNEAIKIHEEVVAGASGFLELTDPQEMANTLSDRGLPKVLSEVPNLEPVGMLLVGALVSTREGPSVVLEYRCDEHPWTLQHHLRPDPTGLEPFTGPIEEKAMRVVQEGEVRIVSWRDDDGLWILGASAAEAEVLARAALLRQGMASSLAYPNRVH